MSEQKEENNVAVASAESPSENAAATWEQREKELLKQVDEYKLKADENVQKLVSLVNDLKLVTEERDSNKNQVTKLEKDLADALKAQTLPDSQEIVNLKNRSEDMLTRAKEVIFEKTKVIKNQELQIEALLQQVASLKEVVAITKDLLEIRNVETKHLQDKLDCMESKINLEKEKQELVRTKLERMVAMNTDLKREYEAQLCLFNALREKYSERELARNVLDELRNAPTENGQADGENNSASTSNNDENPPTTSGGGDTATE